MEAMTLGDLAIDVALIVSCALILASIVRSPR